MVREWDEHFDGLMRQVLKGLPAGAEIVPDLDLAAQGVDSMAIVELIVQVEETYGIVFPDEAIHPETFATPSALWKAISGQISPERSGEGL
ncbi:phosphopantetheine-binding protein [Streptomyces phyllanthi]|uniref:Carrier domain-containing protein n=1 Tax=Streptomyces phyllanthi TaxID=1803180 RepID=A0A5N8VY47_9ACTN|nr:phosphopantetheine-binding protein [Streptomyces phyllanthi]MPY38958.1 hypothetical protein [Streptomyces phyllanthi]